eukprot:2502657-Heterocapsa_arctica.AAC.1
MSRRKKDNQEVTEAKHVLLRSGAGSLTWTARMARTDRALVVSPRQSTSRRAQVRQVRHLLHLPLHQLHLGLHLLLLKDFNKAAKKLNNYELDAVLIVMPAVADSGFATTECQKSQTGQIVRI